MLLTQKLNREPLLREIAKESGFTETKVRDLLELIEDPISLETPVGDGESVYGDLIEDDNAELPEDVTTEGMRSDELARALTRLNPRMRLVIARRFGLDGQAPRTLEQVGCRARHHPRARPPAGVTRLARAAVAGAGAVPVSADRVGGAAGEP